MGCCCIMNDEGGVAFRIFAAQLFIMKYNIRLALLSLAVFVCFASSYAQPSQTIYNKSLGWTITIPEGFEAVPQAEVDALQQKGFSKIEEQVGKKIENRAVPIFTFRTDASHYIQSAYLPLAFSREQYAAECKAGYDLVYKTFSSQFPNNTVDTIQTLTIIDSLEFQLLKLKIDLGKFDLNLLMYSRLFGNRFFSLNIMYVDHLTGKKMIDAWKASEFVSPTGIDTLVAPMASQQAPPRQVYNKEFDWSITIPANFDIVSEAAMKAMEKKGMDALENTMGEKIIDQTKKIFVFNRGPQNYFESRYQPYDNKDDDYIEVCLGLNNILYETFQNQFPESTIDTVQTVEKVDGLEFQVFRMNVHIKQMTISTLMYSRLFGNKDLTVSLVYLDAATGKEMLDAWRGSKFGRK